MTFYPEVCIAYCYFTLGMIFTERHLLLYNFKMGTETVHYTDVFYLVDHISLALRPWCFKYVKEKEKGTSNLF